MGKIFPHKISYPYIERDYFLFSIEIYELSDLLDFQGLYSLSGKTSYRKISWSLEAARFGFKPFQSLWNLAGTSAALLPRCLSNLRAIRPLQHTISRLRDFTGFGGKTSYRLVNRGPEVTIVISSVCRREVDTMHWAGRGIYVGSTEARMRWIHGFQCDCS